MSSSKSIAAARARRSGEQQQQRPNTSIASAKAFNPAQQFPPQQQNDLILVLKSKSPDASIFPCFYGAPETYSEAQ